MNWIQATWKLVIMQIINFETTEKIEKLKKTPSRGGGVSPCRVIVLLFEIVIT